MASGKVDNMEGIRGETELYTEKYVDVEKNRDGEKRNSTRGQRGQTLDGEVRRGERTGDNGEEQ